MCAHAPPTHHDGVVQTSETRATLVTVAYRTRTLDLAWVPVGADVIVVHNDDFLDRSALADRPIWRRGLDGYPVPACLALPVVRRGPLVRLRDRARAHAGPAARALGADHGRCATHQVAARPDITAPWPLAAAPSHATGRRRRLQRLHLDWFIYLEDTLPPRRVATVGPDLETALPTMSPGAQTGRCVLGICGRPTLGRPSTTKIALPLRQRVARRGVAQRSHHRPGVGLLT